ncbi:MAG: hypothetical protein GY768_03595 [Planctomycetaceae bacterium]|nr:hypothetical protein [Planctomycetaceae bacterium]
MVVRIDEDFLKDQTDPQSRKTTLVLADTELYPGFQTWPILRALGGAFTVYPIPDPHYQIYLNATGRLEPTGQGVFPDIPVVRFHIESGTATLESEYSLFKHRFFFPEELGSGSPKFKTWLNQTWPHSDAKIMGIVLGHDSLHLKLKDDANQKKRRVAWSFSTDRDLGWALQDCGRGADQVTPDKIVSDRRENVKVVLKRFNPTHGLSVRPRLFAKDASAVWYLISKPGTPSRPLREVVRPDFDIEATDGEQTSLWSPATLQVQSGANKYIVLHDQTPLQTILETPSSSATSASLAWFVTDLDNHLQMTDLNLPSLMTCIGSRPLPLQSEYLWQFTDVTPRPPEVTPTRAWVRYHLPERNRESTPGQTRSLSDAIPIPETAFPLAKWSMRLGPPQSDDDGRRRRLQLTLTPGDPARLQWEIYDPEVEAFSPQLQAYRKELSAPAAPPASKLLAASDSTTDPLEATSLVFANRVPDTTDPTLQCETSASDGTAIFDLTATGDAVAAYWPLRTAAVIDPISATSSNLPQRRDPITRRVVVDRDPGHGLIAWPLTAMEIQANGELINKTRKNPAGKLQGARALAPWVERHRDFQNEVNKDSLHHRNLVQEIGEYATASQDRASEGEPAAFAANLQDFLEAIRDPFTVAVDELSTSTRSEIVNWLPGANLDQIPQVRLNLPGANAPTLEERLPSISMQAGTISQQLRAKYFPSFSTDETPWLKFAAQWRRYAGNPPRPEIELAPADDASGRQQIVDGAAAPLLLLGSDITACDFATFEPADPDQPSETWLLSGDTNGKLSLGDIERGGQTTATFHIPVDPGPGDLTAAIRALVVAERSDGERLIWASNADGVAVAWRRAEVDNAPVRLGEHGAADLAAAGIFQDLVVWVVVDRTTGQVQFIAWDPDASLGEFNPLSLTVLQNDGDAIIDGRTVVDLQLSVSADKVIVAVAHETIDDSAPAQVLSATPNGSAWDFSELGVLGADFVAQHVSATIANDDRLVVALAAKDSLSVVVRFEVFLDDGSIGSGKVDPAIQRSTVVQALRLFARPDAEGLHPATAGNRIEAGLQAALWVADDERHAAYFPQEPEFPLWDQPRLRESVLAFSGKLSPVPNKDPRGPLRPYVLWGGTAGAARLWDWDAGAVRAIMRDHTHYYDNLGEVALTHAGQFHTSRDASHVAQVESTNAPMCTGHERSDAKSIYAPLDARISFSFSSVSGQLLVDESADEEHKTVLGWNCESLTLLRDGLGWVPDDLRDACPDPERPELKHAIYRHYPGAFGFYSNEEDETPDVHRLPRIAGLPVQVKAIKRIEFAEDTSPQPRLDRIHFADILSLELIADIVHPLEVADKDQAETGLSGDFDFVHGVHVELVFSRSAEDQDLVLTGLTAAGDSTWPLTGFRGDPVDFPFPAVPGQVSSITFRPSLVKLKGGAKRLSLSVSGGEAQLAGGSASLSDPQVLLVGYGHRGTENPRKFGFEVLRESATALKPIDVVQPRLTAEVSGPIDRLIVNEPGQYWGVLSVAGNQWQWNDAATGRLISKATPGLRCIHAAAVGQAPAHSTGIILGNRIRIWDTELGAEIAPPGLITPLLTIETDLAAAAIAGPYAYLIDRFGQLMTRYIWSGGQISKVSVTEDTVVGMETIEVGGRTWIVVAVEDNSATSNGVKLLFPGTDGQEQTLSFPVRRLHVRSTESGAQLVVSDGQTNGKWFRITPSDDSIRVDVVRSFTATSRFDDIVLGLDGDEDAVLYSDEGNLFALRATARAPISLGLPFTIPNASLSFVSSHDGNLHQLAVAGTGSDVRLARRLRTSSTWGNWAEQHATLGTPQTMSPRLSVAQSPRDDGWDVVVGPAALPGERPIAIDTPIFIEVWAPIGTGRQSHEIKEIPSRSLLGPTLITGLVDAPQAVFSLEGETSVRLFDLRTGMPRAPFF